MGIIENILDKNNIANRLTRMTGDVKKNERVCPFCGRRMVLGKSKDFWQCPSNNESRGPCWLGAENGYPKNS